MSAHRGQPSYISECSLRIFGYCSFSYKFIIEIEWTAEFVNVGKFVKKHQASAFQYLKKGQVFLHIYFLNYTYRECICFNYSNLGYTLCIAIYLTPVSLNNHLSSVKWCVGPCALKFELKF